MHLRSWTNFRFVWYFTLLRSRLMLLQEELKQERIRNESHQDIAESSYAPSVTSIPGIECSSQAVPGSRLNEALSIISALRQSIRSWWWFALCFFKFNISLGNVHDEVLKCRISDGSSNKMMILHIVVCSSSSSRYIQQVLMPLNNGLQGSQYQLAYQRCRGHAAKSERPCPPFHWRAEQTACGGDSIWKMWAEFAWLTKITISP